MNQALKGHLGRPKSIIEKEAKISCSRRVQGKQEEEELKEQRADVREAGCRVSWKDPWPSGWSSSNLSSQESGLAGTESHCDSGGAPPAPARGSMYLFPTGPSFLRSSTGGSSRQSQVGSRDVYGVWGSCLLLSSSFHKYALVYSGSRFPV